jgi:small subunit ribosomal protein S14
VAKRSWIIRQQSEPKYGTRKYNRCALCGRRHAYMRQFGICRICFRENALAGNIPGVRKASW